MIMSCKCTHTAQDTLHGAGQRVFTPTKKSKGDLVSYKCTVCDKEKTAKAEK